MNCTKLSKCAYVFFLCFCLNNCQRFMMNCVPKGRNLTCCLSSQSSHPLSSLDYHQVEAYRASKRRKCSLCMCGCTVHLYTLYCEITHCYFCVLQKELHYFSLLSTKRDSQAHTTKCEYNLHICPILTIRRHVISFTMHSTFTICFSHYLSVQGLGGS